MAGYLLVAPRSWCQRLVHARLASFKSQYQVSVSDRPCAVSRPSALTSVANTNSPASLWPPLTMPNCKQTRVSIDQQHGAAFNAARDPSRSLLFRLELLSRQLGQNALPRDLVAHELL